jgi:hypothetical protein
MKVSYYGPDHPMLVNQSGDPARGEWLPKNRKRKRR